MSTPATLAGGSKTAYGMGLGIDALYGHLRLRHDGETGGFHATNATFPDEHIDVIVLENDVGGAADQMENAIFGVLFPDAVAAARRPSAGEDPAVRARAIHLIDAAMHGKIVASELAPDFRRFAKPETQRRIARAFAGFGAPAAVIYRGRQDGFGSTDYAYRAEFGKYSALVFFISIDKTTDLVSGIGYEPAP